jgi:thymidylate kinase
VSQAQSPFEKIIVDGMDGSGKSTLVSALRELGYPVQDRGNATHMVDDDTLTAEPQAFYVILLAPVGVCRARLAAAGKPLDEWCHTEESLSHYRRRYPEIRDRLPSCVYLNAKGSPADVLAETIAALEAIGFKPADSATVDQPEKETACP